MCLRAQDTPKESAYQPRRLRRAATVIMVSATRGSLYLHLIDPVEYFGLRANTTIAIVGDEKLILFLDNCNRFAIRVREDSRLVVTLATVIRGQHVIIGGHSVSLVPTHMLVRLSPKYCSPETQLGRGMGPEQSCSHPLLPLGSKLQIMI